MRFLGFELRRIKAVPPRNDGWIPLQGLMPGWRMPLPDLTVGELTGHSAVFACEGLLAGDVSKLRLKVVARQSSAVWAELYDHNAELLARPNHYQTRPQFLECWMHSRLLYGNAYVLLKRDARQRVNAMYVLDPCRVLPMVSDGGQVFYKLQYDRLNRIREGTSELDLIIPASEIIHDRWNTFHHPLIGNSPVAAAAHAARVGIEIQSTAASFFANGAAPGGILTTPAGMSTEDAAAVKAYWEDNFQGKNSGRIAVIGADLKFTSFAMKGTDAQLIEQQKFSAEDVCRAFRIPPHMIGAAPPPAYANVEALQAAYYSQTLQVILEHIEGALDAGLGFGLDKRCEFDVAALMRMDTATRYRAHSDAVGGGWMSPNEARAAENLPPVPGGDSPYLQQQNWSLEQLSRRFAPADEPSTRGGASDRKRSTIIRNMLNSGYSDEQAARHAGLPPGWKAKEYLASMEGG